MEAASLLRVLCLLGEGGGGGTRRQSFNHTITPTPTTRGTASTPAPTPTTNGTPGPRSRSRAGSGRKSAAASAGRHGTLYCGETRVQDAKDNEESFHACACVPSPVCATERPTHYSYRHSVEQAEGTQDDPLTPSL